MNEKTKEALEKLKTGIENIMSSEEYIKFIKFMSKFHNYSFNNIMLIRVQKPEATLVAGYMDWIKKFHRIVKKGEKGITIIAPSPYKKTITDENGKEKEVKCMGYKATTVFDISQTEGEDIPTLEVKELTGEIKDFDSLKLTLSGLTLAKIRYGNIEGGAKGYFRENENLIMIKEDMSEKQTIKTLLHEITHSRLHTKEKLKARNEPTSRNQLETEAESIAYLVSNYYGIDTSEYSFMYVASWIEETNYKQFKESLNFISKEADKMINELEEIWKTTNSTMLKSS